MKKGFTLIELLAVIVILAIIALIATPIVLNIIEESRDNANKRSIDLYAKAVENAIAKYHLENNASPKEFSQLNIEYEGNVACQTSELYEKGEFYLANCKVNNEEVNYTFGTKQEKKVYLSEVCDPVSVAEEEKYTLGDKYTCTVDPNKPAYTFHVLTTPKNGSINLIMDSNIRTGGEAVKEANPTVEQRGLVAWLNESDYISLGGESMRDSYGECIDGGRTCANNTYGPISAMNYLEEATKDWTNTNQQIVSTFTDETGETHNMAKKYTVNARMPYLSEVGATGCDITNYTFGSCPLWMTDYLHADTYYYPDRTAVSNVAGYWILSSWGYNSSNYYAWIVDSYGQAYHGSDWLGWSASVNWDGYFGVRPVINLSI